LIKMPHAARMPLQKTAASSRKTALGPLCKALLVGEVEAEANGSRERAPDDRLRAGFE
jgi:hypothetical protein